MNTNRADEINVVKLSLHGRLVAYLAGFLNGRNVLNFAEEFVADAGRPTFSLITHPSFPHAERLMAEAWARNQRLHPSLSNLLPEGSLRELIAQGLKVHVDNEFHLLSYLGSDLPGALIVDKPHLDDVMEKARNLWPQALKELPMSAEHKFKLKEHWGKLSADLSIK
tara:strand:- start:8711 stop:9211 length:501 start_codon:yes stop_codon:yes gene_type:complete